MTLLVIILLVVPFGIAAIIGAPYVPILGRDTTALLNLAELKPGQTIIDLGSGDGRFLRAAARRGYRGIGYEINPFLYAVSRVVTWRYRHNVAIHLADFWHTAVPPADAIYIFLIARLMPKLDTKLTRELTAATTVVSFVFPIPGRIPETTTRNAFRYRYRP